MKTEQQTAQHTPGPWKTERVEDNPEFVEILGFDDSIVCCFDRSQQLGNEDEANARLIATAPELLGALEILLGSVEYCRNAPAPFRPTDKIIKNARAALAKAKGQ